MSARKTIGGWMVAAGALLSISGDGNICEHHITPVPLDQLTAMDMPPGIEDPQGYRRLISARRSLEFSLDHFVTKGIDRLKKNVGLAQFRAGGQLHITPSYEGHEGKCTYTSKGHTKALPELFHLFDDYARLMEVQHHYTPCKQALLASPELQESYYLSMLKRDILQGIADRKDMFPLMLAEIIDRVIDEPLRDFCVFSMPTPPAESQSITSPQECSTYIPQDTYWIYDLPFFNKVGNGTITITVENPHIHEAHTLKLAAKEGVRER